MAKKPPNFEWLGFSDEQRRLLGYIDFIGNNGWGRNGQTDVMMPSLLGRLADSGVTLDQLLQAMDMIGYGPRALHQLERWESKRLTGRFGR